MDLPEQRKMTEAYAVPAWFVRWLIPVVILGFMGWLSHISSEGSDLHRRLTVLETRGPEIERRLDRIERQNDDIKTMLQLFIDKGHVKARP
jgi:hypothetical protein